MNVVSKDLTTRLAKDKHGARRLLGRLMAPFISAPAATDENHYRAIVEHANEGILIVDAATGLILEANPSLLRKLGRQLSELQTLQFSEVMAESTDRGARDPDRPTSIAAVSREVMLKKKDGTTLSVDIGVCPISYRSRPALCYIMRDATRRKALEAKLLRSHSEARQRAEYLARNDALTGLANRSSLRAYLAEALAVERHGMLALLVLDISDFRSLNDTLGADVGDAVLLEMAQRLKQALDGRGFIARVGSDEFAVALPAIADLNEAMRMAQTVQNALAVPMHYLMHSLDISANVGVSLSPPDHEADTMLSHADMALSMAKSCGRSSIQVFEAEMNARIRKRLDLSRALKRALETDELLVHYQPVVDIQSHRLLSLEALVRWQHPEYGLISPADFIPLAEENGLIVPLGERVLRMVCEQGAKWRSEEVPIVPVAVNLSPQQFQRQSVSMLVQNILRETGMEARYLAIEITEGSLMSNVGRFVNDLQALRASGVRILVDDFGTGYSSLSYLKHLPLDTLKIDRSFIGNVDSNAADEAIVSAILAMARSLGLKVVAEGVETKAQLAVLEKHGCEMAQGYYFSKPVPAEHCVELLRELAKRPSFTDTLRMQLSGAGSGKPRLSVIGRKR